jgi:hypothetical protein
LTPQLDRALERLATAIAAHDGAGARQAALDSAQWSLDLQLLHRPVARVDTARFGLWSEQLALDLDRGDLDSVSGDVFTLFYLRDRIRHSLPEEKAASMNEAIGILQEAVVERDQRMLRHASAILAERGPR